MKKQIICVLFLFLSGFSMGQAFEKGGNYITLGYGFDPFYHPLGVYGAGPIVLGYEYGVTDVVGIGRFGAGGTVGTTFYPGTYSNGVAYLGYRISLLAKVAYHFEFNVPKMDVYAGVGVGGHFGNEPYFNGFGSYGLRSRVRVATHVFAGIRYYFTPAFGVYAEAGYGLSALNGGMVFHF
ncbi:MAG: hypothetical protein A3D92_20705 [Bacteroidetes bacterium RIFCSPHIGHO2_02_FULL_44_7]|nr:MAG: hypothetical protein A3D92_20705 [Bacteroidetes bacterium RIFCSPHIGHO2_02_FULL_44_7]